MRVKSFKRDGEGSHQDPREGRVELGLEKRVGVGETEPQGMAFNEEGTATRSENPGRANIWCFPRVILSTGDSLGLVCYLI